MSATSRRTGTSSMDGPTVAVCVAVVFAVLSGLVLTVAVHLGQLFTPTGQVLPWSPFALLGGLVGGDLTWPVAASWVAIALTVLVAALTVGVLVCAHRRSRRRTRVDRAAPHLARGKDLTPLTTGGARKVAARLGVDGPVGLPLGITVAGGNPLWQSWESVAVCLMGPRAGKTSSLVVPGILGAPGPVITTSRFRDALDATRDPRAQIGQVWVFDPQQIADEPSTWWWNPLSYVTDEVQALKLARIFVDAGREPGARTDAYFDKAGPSLIAGMLHAAALAGLPITQVYLWLTTPDNDRPGQILREHGFPRSAAAVEAIVHVQPKQRDGVYGTALELMSFLISDQAVRWVTTDPRGDHRRQFDPARFVTSTDTLYLLSREGEASTGPLVAALTVAVIEAAESTAKRSPGGRLPVPLVAELDEVANTCRLRGLPSWYSWLGGRGVVVRTYLQSWSQGVEVWGRDGMTTLWSASTVQVVGAGISEVQFLSDLSTLAGTFRATEVSTSTHRGQRTVSRSTSEDRILSVSDLTELPPGRAVVLGVGVPATLIRTVPWWEGPHAADVELSRLAHDPSQQATPPSPPVPVVNPPANGVPVAELRSNNPWVGQ